MPVVYRIQQDIYWHKVLQLCEASTSMIRCYESKKAVLSQMEWFDYVALFENLGGKLDRVIRKHAISVGSFGEGMDELEKTQAKIAAVLLVANKKLRN